MGERTVGRPLKFKEPMEILSKRVPANEKENIIKLIDEYLERLEK